MKLSLPVTNLRQVLSATKPAISGRTTLPVLNCVRLAASTLLQASATNFDLWISSDTTANVAQPGAVCVRHEKALAAAMAFSGETMELVAEKAALTMTCGKAVVKLPVFDAQEYPECPTDGFGKPVVFAHHGLFRKLAAFASVDPARPALNAIYLDSKTIVATTGQMLLAIETPDELDLSVPTETALAVADMAGKEITLCQNESLLRFQSDGLTITARKLADQYPKHWRNVVSKPDFTITTNREALLEACKLACLAGDEKAYDSIRLNFSKGKCLVQMNGKDSGQSGMEIDCDAERDFSIGFAPKYLLPCLRAFDGESIALGFIDDISPLVIRQNGMTAVALPNRVA